MMDESARRQLAFNIANNRTNTNVAACAAGLFDWMTSLGEAGEQALIAANNSVSPQSSLASIVGEATKNYEFMASPKTVPADVAERVEKALAAPEPEPAPAKDKV